jgi:hypothetical protein
MQDIGTLTKMDVDVGPPLVNLCLGLNQTFQGAVPFSPRTMQFKFTNFPQMQFSMSLATVRIKLPP